MPDRVHPSAEAKDSSPSGSSADPRPRAAYLLGYSSFIMRLWQLLCWLYRGQYGRLFGKLDSKDGVPGAVDDLREAVAVLANAIPEDANRNLVDLFPRITAITERGPLVPKGRERDWEYWFRAKESAGYQEWKNLVLLSQAALSEKSPLKRIFQ